MPRGGTDGLLETVLADARMTAAFRAERHEFRSRGDGLAQAARLAWRSDAFLAQVLHRVAVDLEARGVPVVPRLARALAATTAQVRIAPGVDVAPGLYLAHGQVTVEAPASIGPGVIIFPWVTIAPDDAGGPGPSIGAGARIGTGAQVLGPVRVGARARVGANAVVDGDVPEGATVVGVPARPLARSG